MQNGSNARQPELPRVSGKATATFTTLSWHHLTGVKITPSVVPFRVPAPAPAAEPIPWKAIGMIAGYTALAIGLLRT